MIFHMVCLPSKDLLLKPGYFIKAKKNPKPQVLPPEDMAQATNVPCAAASSPSFSTVSWLY